MSGLALAAVGACVVVLALIDLFLTVFNYDGFTFLAGRYRRGLWRMLRVVTRPLPPRMRRATLSFGSMAMLPATVAAWLAAEIVGFALIRQAGTGRRALHLAEVMKLARQDDQAEPLRRPEERLGQRRPAPPLAIRVARTAGPVVGVVGAAAGLLKMRTPACVVLAAARFGRSRRQLAT
ncbi:MAG TPA: hypothetical protein VFW24_02765 [Acidimicrobiales bacterium]|nr:hypothetical protein [Acidimicrobiales bacterium]